MFVHAITVCNVEGSSGALQPALVVEQGTKQPTTQSRRRTNTLKVVNSKPHSSTEDPMSSITNWTEESVKLARSLSILSRSLTFFFFLPLSFIWFSLSTVVVAVDLCEEKSCTQEQEQCYKRGTIAGLVNFFTSSLHRPSRAHTFGRRERSAWMPLSFRKRARERKWSFFNFSALPMNQRQRDSAKRDLLYRYCAVAA